MPLHHKLKAAVNPKVKISSQSLDKFLKSPKNLAKPPPKLWPDDPKIQTLSTDDREIPVLNLAHPLLRKLDSCKGVREFNQVHSRLVVSGLSQHSLVTSQAVKKLCTLRAIAHAVVFFMNVQEPDAFLCNSIMRSYVNVNNASCAVGFYYECMVEKGVAPNHYTFPIVVKAWVEIGSLTEGEKVHGRILKHGFESDLFVRNALIHMYSVFQKVGRARLVFDAASVLDLVSWNSIIDGYIKNEEVDVARELFDEMTERDIFSWNSMISGYAVRGDMEEAKWLFERMPCRDVVSWNCMIDGYARIGNISEACRIFSLMPSRNVVSWNTILALHIRCKDYHWCLSLFDKMVLDGEIKPNGATLMSILTACTHTGDLHRGKLVHSYIESNEIECDVLLSTALLTMYTKCGDMDSASNVFDQMPNRSIVSWNAMIMGYGMHGHGEKALETFLEMEKRGLMPNDVTFTCVLSACTHCRMVLEGWWYFNLMSRVYKIEPKVQHFGCMVDLLARAGLMKDSQDLISRIPEEAGSSLWGALLSACSIHSNFQLGEIVAKRLIELEPMDIGPYVLLSNMYAAEGDWDAVENVRVMMKEKGLQKKVGSSLVQLAIESGNSAKDILSHRRSIFYSMLSEIGSQLKVTCRDSTAMWK